MARRAVVSYHIHELQSTGTDFRGLCRHFVDVVREAEGAVPDEEPPGVLSTLDLLTSWCSRRSVFSCPCLHCLYWRTVQMCSYIKYSCSASCPCLGCRVIGPWMVLSGSLHTSVAETRILRSCKKGNEADKLNSGAQHAATLFTRSLAPA